jgi:hypothetical protein
MPVEDNLCSTIRSDIFELGQCALENNFSEPKYIKDAIDVFIKLRIYNPKLWALIQGGKTG